MKNFCIVVLLIGLSHLEVKAQNLVPNWSFEQNNSCPQFGDQIHFATGWEKYSANVTTPDYYNSCALPTSMGVPKNYGCYQVERRNCNAYAAIVTYSAVSLNYREHIGIQLNQPLSIGQKYYITFYAVLGEMFVSGNYDACPSNNIGLRLSTTSYNINNPAPIDNFAHINYSTVLNDSINWTKISGSIIADSTYQYLIIGNFFDSNNTDTLTYTCSTCTNIASYYLIDDVCISLDSSLCNNGLDTLLCLTSDNYFSFENEIGIFPNPFDEEITIEFSDYQDAELVIYNVFYETVFYTKTVNEKSSSTSLSTLPNGIYFMKITWDDGKKATLKKIIKQKL